LQFLGSPSIRFNGRDIEPGADERQDYGLGWRLYIYEDGSSSKVVSRELLFKALQGGK